MELKNSETRYGAITKTIHWVMALLIIMMLVMGLVMGDIEPLKDKLWVYGLHKSLGITILILVSLRIVWHLISKKPPFVPTITKLERYAAHAVHVFLYTSMIGMPMSGWLMSSAAGRPPSFFNLFTMPAIIEENEQLRDVFGTTHEILGYTLIIAIVMHVAGALKHHFISKDATLKRMLPFSK